MLFEKVLYSLFNKKRKSLNPQFTILLFTMTLPDASANAGSKSRFSTGMKSDDRPRLISVHCVNHKIELAVKIAFEAVGFSYVDNL